MVVNKIKKGIESISEVIKHLLNLIYNEIRESIYIRWLKENKGLICLCAFISAFMCILTYPGIMYTDSYARTNMTTDLKLSINAFLLGDSELNNYSSWITIIPSFFILLSKEIVGSVVLYTYIQCFLFVLMTMVMGDNLICCNHKIWNRICILCIPVIWAYGVYYEASVGCISAIMAMILLIYKYRKIEKRTDRIFTLVLFVFVTFIAFGYRANAFTIIPFLCFSIFLLYKKISIKMILMGCLMVGFYLTSLVPKLLNIDTMSSYAGSFVWEIVSTIQSMDDEKKVKYIDYLDDIFGENTTEIALEKNTYTEEDSSINSIWWGNPFNSKLVSEKENTAKVLEKYIALIKEEPKAYLRTKWEFALHTMGMNMPLRMVEYDYNRDGNMSKYGFNNSMERKEFVENFHSYMEFMEIHRIPWIMFGAALLLLLVWRVKFYGMKNQINLYEIVYGTAVFYYGAYIVNTQSFEFRYYFPSWLLLMLISISLSINMCFSNVWLRRIYKCSMPIVVIICMLGTHLVSAKEGNEKLAIIKEEGKMIYSDNARCAYYYENKIYIVALKKEAVAYKYKIKFETMDEEEIVSEFLFEDKELKTSFWNEDIAMVDVPDGIIGGTISQILYDNVIWEENVEILTGVEEK